MHGRYYVTYYNVRLFLLQFTSTLETLESFLWFETIYCVDILIYLNKIFIGKCLFM